MRTILLHLLVESRKYINAEFDLYQKLVIEYSDWPTFSYGIKFIAKQIGFSWRDADPSG